MDLKMIGLLMVMLLALKVKKTTSQLDYRATTERVCKTVISNKYFFISN